MKNQNLLSFMLVASFQIGCNVSPTAGERTEFFNLQPRSGGGVVAEDDAEMLQQIALNLDFFLEETIDPLSPYYYPPEYIDGISTLDAEGREVLVSVALLQRLADEFVDENKCSTPQGLQGYCVTDSFTHDVTNMLEMTNQATGDAAEDLIDDIHENRRGEFDLLLEDIGNAWSDREKSCDQDEEDLQEWSQDQMSWFQDNYKRLNCQRRLLERQYLSLVASEDLACLMERLLGVE